MNRWSMYFGGLLMLAGVWLAPQAASAAELALSPGVIGKTWHWVNFVTPKETITVDLPEHYTIEFWADGRVALRADCNRGVGGFTLGADNRISFGEFGVTRALCPEGSLSDRYLRELSRVNSYFLKDGDFFLELPFDSGTLRFTAKQ